MWNQGYPINWSAPLNRGLLSWWLRPPVLVSNARFLDLCGRNHGALLGSPLWSGATPTGGWGSLACDGTDDGIVPANPTQFELGAADWTLVLWANIPSVASNRVLLSKSAAGSWAAAGKVWLVDTTTGKQLFDSHSVGSLTSTTVVPLGVWNQLAVSFVNSTNTLAFYLNGLGDGGGTLALAADNAAHVLRWGLSTDATNPMLGALNDIRFYNARVLAADEVKRLYQVARTGYRYELNWLEDDDDVRRPVPAFFPWPQATRLVPPRPMWVGVEY